MDIDASHGSPAFAVGLCRFTTCRVATTSRPSFSSLTRVSPKSLLVLFCVQSLCRRPDFYVNFWWAMCGLQRTVWSCASGTSTKNHPVSCYLIVLLQYHPLYSNNNPKNRRTWYVDLSDRYFTLISLHKSNTLLEDLVLHSVSPLVNFLSPNAVRPIPRVKPVGT